MPDVADGFGGCVGVLRDPGTARTARAGRLRPPRPGLHAAVRQTTCSAASSASAAATDAEWRAAVTLWWAAWNCVPAGSLPADDVALCRLCRSWARREGLEAAASARCMDSSPARTAGCITPSSASRCWWPGRSASRSARRRREVARGAGLQKAGQDHSVPVVSLGTETGTEPGRDRSVLADGNGRDGTGRDSIPKYLNP